MTRQELQAAIKLLAPAENIPDGQHKSLTGYERENLHMARALLQIIDAAKIIRDSAHVYAIPPVLDGTIKRAEEPMYEDGER